MDLHTTREVQGNYIPKQGEIVVRIGHRGYQVELIESPISLGQALNHARASSVPIPTSDSITDVTLIRSQISSLHQGEESEVRGGDILLIESDQVVVYATVGTPIRNQDSPDGLPSHLLALSVPRETTAIALAREVAWLLRDQVPIAKDYTLVIDGIGTVGDDYELTSGDTLCIRPVQLSTSNPDVVNLANQDPEWPGRHVYFQRPG